MELIKQYPWMTSLWFLMVIGFTGMFLHFLKKNVKGETLTDIKNYFSDNFKSTLIAFLTTMITVIGYDMTIATDTIVDILVVVQLGYNFDSALNKWDKPS